MEFGKRGNSYANVKSRAYTAGAGERVLAILSERSFDSRVTTLWRDELAAPEQNPPENRATAFLISFLSLNSMPCA